MHNKMLTEKEKNFLSKFIKKNCKFYGLPKILQVWRY